MSVLYLRQNRVFENPPWTEPEEHLLIDMHWLDGIGAKSIATRLARSNQDVIDQITIIKRRTKESPHECPK